MEDIVVVETVEIIETTRDAPLRSEQPDVIEPAVDVASDTEEKPERDRFSVGALYGSESPSTAMVNRFERVDEIKGNSVTVNLWENGGRVCADVTGPMIGEDIQTEVAGQDGSLSVPQALNIAIDLARRTKTTVVVIDEAGLWSSKWGELYQPVVDGPH